MITRVAAQLGCGPELLRVWVRQAEIDDGSGPSDALSSDERNELTRLRRENRRLQMEREILKKAAAFFAKENT